MNILDHIPYGKDNAISRVQLIVATGYTDRKMRESIAQARRETPILNNQDGGGYYQPTEADKPLVERFVRQEERRAKSIFYSLKAARKFVR